MFPMGRVSTVRDEQVFSAVGARLVGDGAITIEAVVAETGVSVGSLYHRYGSREGLLALTWLDAVRAFQAQFLAELESEGEDAGERAALATPRFCRSDRQRAIVLSCCRAAEFYSPATPQHLQQEISRVNKAAAAAIRRYAKRSGYSLEACRLGLVAFPLAAVRLYLPSRPPPKTLDAYVSAAFWSAVETG
jgi:AcrR family transcriptional regulator